MYNYFKIEMDVIYKKCKKKKKLLETIYVAYIFTLNWKK